MRIFKTKAFGRWATKMQLHNDSLKKAVIEIGCGKYEVALGGHLYKKRIALGSKGKSGGVRTIVAFKSGEKAIFVYGFSKKQRSNITTRELAALKRLIKLYFTYSEEEIEKILKIKELIEVK